MTRVEFSALTDTGIKRTNNEDSFLVMESKNLYAVADGMGGHSSGEIASKIAVETISDFFRNSEISEDSTWPYAYDDNISFEGNKLKTAVAVANEKIQEYASEHPESRGMGTTVVAVLVLDSRLILCHVGDSRCYLLRDGKLSLVTSDHSWVNEQVKLGFLTEEEAQKHPFRNVITKALGTKGEATAEINETEGRSGDLLLLCTDGLNSMIPDSEIAKIVSKDTGLDEKARSLIDAANNAGGEDNITLVLLKIVQ
ncbi:MAG TPA: Stp1/IreP family PP2C-type Ser/Thr phosphatase [Acidobacteriota bacterium]|nr:Stp1/IreP family PP2C-type Ser/Thr phosphatase [Acidobacteriota bacterium]HNT17084.1 Stp1/IreP family PP2C-type Ser/Thr phosphatase [Acidobacteriota bacterium]HPA26096.1 Stp1/IreP family PP2C-type Ser/Thr phosphatase [Acidobacteriota bacterium]HQO19271.1 Stp1/IreP family PP2C-type Ser/Thr phosphatase [Acidobacteriota bacterium]HQQ46083.1 Stp1/IreP family PP2C-type Ser/Thr phosphatase [Acidobacteriota bacterium]